MKQHYLMRKHGSWKAEEKITRTGNISLGILVANRCPNHKAAMKSLTLSLSELFSKIATFLLIAHYLLFERSPGNGTIFVLNSNNLMNRLVDFFPVAGGHLNTGLSQNILQLAKIAGHRMLTSRGKLGALKTKKDLE
jgi:hypothetical protein